MSRFLFHRSTKIPVNSPNTDWGSIAVIVAKAKTSADLVSKLSHKTIAKLTIELVRIEKNCPVHIIANTFSQFFMTLLLYKKTKAAGFTSDGLLH